jgi:hypothetical protein
MLIDFDESMISIETIDDIEVFNDTSANIEPTDVDWWYISEKIAAEIVRWIYFLLSI